MNSVYKALGQVHLQCMVTVSTFIPFYFILFLSTPFFSITFYFILSLPTPPLSLMLILIH